MSVPSTGGPAVFERTRVLLVDGDADSLEMYGLMLTRAGFDVDTAVDGVGAVARLGLRVPAVIALEVALRGEVSGYDLCRRVRTHSDTHAVPLVAVTAGAFASDAAKATAAGCNVVLTKPCLPSALVSEVQRLLHLTATASPAADAPVLSRVSATAASIVDSCVARAELSPAALR
jgi:two-component system, cell cycle response regulator DivK